MTTGNYTHFLFFLSLQVWVYIDDVNDNNPVFVNPQTEVTVTENNNPGFIFTTVTATDADFGQNAELVYVITGGNQLGHFDLVTDVNGATHIATSTSLDREAIENYTLTITAADKGEPSRNSSINITVNVGDVNDNAPMYNQTINAASVVEVNKEIVLFFLSRAFLVHSPGDLSVVRKD